MSLSGIPELAAQVKRVQELVNGERMQDEMMPAVEAIRDDAKRNVKLGPGVDSKGRPRKHLRDLIFATKGRKPRGVIGMIASALNSGPSVIAGVDLKKAPWAHLVEWKHRIVTRYGRDTGKVTKGHPFMRPAVDRNRAYCAEVVANAIKKLLAPFSR